jgi:crotonobetainyl-CoA:carnitine CoA-transferase CaiB-like acyl-CoA transferase
VDRDFAAWTFRSRRCASLPEGRSTIRTSGSGEWSSAIRAAGRNVGNPIRFATSPRARTSSFPAHGEHTSEILESLAYSGAEIRDLEAERRVVR